MATVTVELPSVLSTVIGGVNRIEVEAETLAGGLEELVRVRPELRIHLFDETGAFRQHVLCFHNRTNTRWLESHDVVVSEGDTITILQAVSGG